MKALGVKKCSFGTIRLLWKLDNESILSLTRAGTRMGRHFAVWKWAGAMVSGNPGKEDYMKLKAYRSMLLLNWNKKAVYIIAMELLSNVREGRGLLSH
jgi:hypothetical protein